MIEVWEIILPPKYNYSNFFKVRTKNPINTLQKLFKKVSEVAVCPPRKIFVHNFYLSKEEFEKLMNGESVVVITSSSAYNSMCEAQGTAKLSISPFKHEWKIEEIEKLI